MKKPALKLTSSDLILRDSREYAIYVCSFRAIPSIEDGLKFGQRIALWLLRNRAEKIKTVGLGGLMASERLFVHGDVSATDAIGKLAAPYNNNVPLLIGHGQFGSRVAPTEGIGAPRYTEVQRSSLAEKFLYADLDLVPTEDNYDGSNQQPQHFLPLIPTVLLNGVKGVAVGWSTDILPRSFKGLVQATQDALMGKPIKTLKPYYDRYNVTVDHISGNQWLITGKANVVDTSSVRITELPVGKLHESFIADLIDMEEKDKINGFTDRSSDQIDITVTFPRGTIKGWTDQDAIKFFKLAKKTTERIVVVDWGGSAIKQYESPEDVVHSFVNWRLALYTTRFNKMLTDTTREFTYYSVLKLLFDNGFTKKLGGFASKADLESEIVAVCKKGKMVLEEGQIERVMNLPTYRWTQDFYNDVVAKIASLSNDITDIKDTLADPMKLKNVYFTELEALKALKV